MAPLKASRVYAPSPTQFNGLVIEPEELDVEIPLSGLTTLHRNRHVPADGTPISCVGDAGILSAAGCPLIVAAYEDSLVFAHAGRDCILDRARVQTAGKKKGRPHESVVNSLMEMLQKKSAFPDSFDPRKVEVWVYWSIQPDNFLHEFAHPTHGRWNRAAADYVRRQFGDRTAMQNANGVWLDLPAIIQGQLVKLGVPVGNIDLDNAYLPESFPTTRTGDGKSRYLVGVVRTS